MSRIRFPEVVPATELKPGKKRLFIGAYGFEDRATGWLDCQNQNEILSHALIIKYKHPKGKNRVADINEALTYFGVNTPQIIRYDVYCPFDIENTLAEKLDPLIPEVDEIIIDVSAMTKLLILAALSHLTVFNGTLRIVYSEAQKYAPTQEEYKASREDMTLVARFPSRGVESIIRLKCLSSIRMQGQPVALIAFTSFNEQLVRHMLGSINPHRLLFINGHSPREELAWRERAVQEIHCRLMEDYPRDNPLDENGLLERRADIVDYRQTFDRMSEIHREYGTYERLICAATGSKMQTVGLFFSKTVYSDIHIEYPTPDSYYVKGLSVGISRVNEVLIPKFSGFLEEFRKFMLQ